MKKLSTLLVIVAMTATLGACNKKKDEEGKEPPVATKPTDEAKPAETKPAETKPAETKPAETKPAEQPAAVATDLPAECAEYKAAIEKLATCDKLPQTSRDALKQAYEQQAASWATIPAEGKKTLGSTCKSASDAVKQSAATVCGW